MAAIPPVPNPWPEPVIPEFGPREVRLSENARTSLKTLRGIAITLAIFGVLVVYFFASKVERMAREGQVIDAIVDDFTRTEDAYRVDFSYRFERMPYSGYEKVSSDTFNALQGQPTVPITVLPSAPWEYTFGKVGTKEIENAYRKGGLILTGIVAFLTLFVYELRGRSRREMKLLATGRALPAQMIEHEVQQRDEVEVIVGRYRVRHPNGNVVVHERKWSVLDAAPPPIGSYFTVLVPITKEARMKEFVPMWALTTAALEPEERSRQSILDQTNPNS